MSKRCIQLKNYQKNVAIFTEQAENSAQNSKRVEIDRKGQKLRNVPILRLKRIISRAKTLRYQFERVTNSCSIDENLFLQKKNKFTKKLKQIDENTAKNCHHMRKSLKNTFQSQKIIHSTQRMIK